MSAPLCSLGNTFDCALHFEALTESDCSTSFLSFFFFFDVVYALTDNTQYNRCTPRQLFARCTSSSSSWEIRTGDLANNNWATNAGMTCIRAAGQHHESVSTFPNNSVIINVKVTVTNSLRAPRLWRSHKVTKHGDWILEGTISKTNECTFIHWSHRNASTIIQ